MLADFSMGGADQIHANARCQLQLTGAELNPATRATAFMSKILCIARVDHPPGMDEGVPQIAECLKLLDRAFEIRMLIYDHSEACLQEGLDLPLLCEGYLFRQGVLNLCSWVEVECAKGYFHVPR